MSDRDGVQSKPAGSPQPGGQIERWMDRLRASAAPAGRQPALLGAVASQAAWDHPGEGTDGRRD